MPNLSIKDVPEAWAEALRQRAARNHRSLQGELMALVEQAVQQEAPTYTADPANPGAPRVVGLDKRGWPIVLSSMKSLLETGEAIDVFAQPLASAAESCT